MSGSAEEYIYAAECERGRASTYATAGEVRAWYDLHYWAAYEEWGASMLIDRRGPLPRRALELYNRDHPGRPYRRAS